jgi:Reverse transcriptase (RNA-dependent DNA polymerase)
MTRVPFGLRNAPQHFQRVMTKLFRDMDEVTIFLDDIVVHTRGGYAAHLAILKEVIQRMHNARIVLNMKKCKFMTPQVEMCGFVADCEGVRPLPGKIEAVRQWHPPTDVKQLRQALGLFNFYSVRTPLCNDCSTIV